MDRFRQYVDRTAPEIRGIVRYGARVGDGGDVVIGAFVDYGSNGEKRQSSGQRQDSPAEPVDGGGGFARKIIFVPIFRADFVLIPSPRSGSSTRMDALGVVGVSRLASPRADGLKGPGSFGCSFWEIASSFLGRVVICFPRGGVGGGLGAEARFAREWSGSGPRGGVCCVGPGVVRTGQSCSGSGKSSSRYRARTVGMGLGLGLGSVPSAFPSDWGYGQGEPTLVRPVRVSRFFVWSLLAGWLGLGRRV